MQKFNNPETRTKSFFKITLKPFSMKNIGLSILALFLLLACSESKKQPEDNWKFLKTVQLEGVSPLGIAEIDNTIWISDGVGNRIVSLAENNEAVRTLDSFSRPMHIATDGKNLLIPEFKENRITITSGAERSVIPIKDSLKAPSSVSVFKNEMAISYFDDNQVLFTNNGVDWLQIGKNDSKALHQPTDVQITQDTIWIADGYNNRVQVYDKKGALLTSIGNDDDINVAMGLYVTDERLFVTDFENNRVLIYTHQGDLLQEISEKIQSPSDVYVRNNNLYILNYLAGNVAIYEYTSSEDTK